MENNKINAPEDEVLDALTSVENTLDLPDIDAGCVGGSGSCAMGCKETCIDGYKTGCNTSCRPGCYEGCKESSKGPDTVPEPTPGSVTSTK